MKQRLYYLLALTITLGFSVKANATIYEVGTAEEFIKHWTANDSIKLVDDIDLSSFTEDNIVDDYTAELSGVRDTSYHFTGKETEAELEEHRTVYIIKNLTQMLANEMHKAKIHHVMFMDCKPDWDGGIYDTYQGTSVLARYTYQCVFTYIILYRNEVNGSTFVGASSDASCFVCQDDGSKFLGVHAYACKAYCKNSYAGIIVGEAKNSQFLGCTAGFGCAVYADGTVDNSYTGGIVGEATNAKFYDCDNRGYVAGGKDCVGGISGKSTNTEFENCINYGSVANTKYSSFEDFTTISDAFYSSLPSSVSCDEIENSLHLQEYKDIADQWTSSNVITLGSGVMKASQVIYWHNMDACIDYMNEVNDDEFLSIANNFGEGISLSEAQQDIGSKLGKPYTVQSYIGFSIAVITAAYQIGKFWYESEDDDNVGGIVGLMDGGFASHCSNYGVVYTADAYAGGIVGEARNDNPKIRNCQNGGLVKGYEQTGGIVGSIESGSVTTCINTGNISNGNSSNTTFGRIYGEKSDGVTSEGNYFVSKTADAETADCRGVTLQMLASGEVTKMLNDKCDSIIWRQTIGEDYYPTLFFASDTITADKIQKDINPTIRTKNASSFIRAIENQYTDIVLTDDIDLNKTLFNLTSNYMPFCGTIDGQNHALKNIHYAIPYFEKATVFSNDNSVKNAGLMSWAKGATFKNLELNNCKIDYCIGFGSYCGLLVGHSTQCTYNNIRLTNGSGLMQSSDANGSLNHGGGLIGYSSHDIISDCSIDALCSMTGTAAWNSENSYIGGFIGEALGTEITKCVNQAPVTSNEDYVGGIVAYIESGKIVSCLNTGKVTGEEQIGGIAGWAKNTDIKACVNTGTIAGNSSLITEGEIGGIAGTYEQKDATGNLMTLCCNWGAVNNQCSTYYDQCGALLGESSPDDDAITQNHNYWCFTKDGEQKTSSNLTADDVTSGKFTYDYNSTYGSEYPLYQDIDLFTYINHYPVPFYDAGTVYNNYLCDGTQGYSNIYHSLSATHTGDIDKFGLCKICGALKTAPHEINIEDAKDLRQFAFVTNKGQDFSSSDIQLKSDCDMAGMECFAIGTAQHPFVGTFNGNNHRIKNMNIDSKQYAGLFGCVGKATINGVIMDSSCVIRSTADGVAGIVGASVTTSGVYNQLYIYSCGNEATVYGGKNTAGILGGVYNNDATNTTISYCYNSGKIVGSSESAAIVGYGRVNLNVIKCYNSGVVSGYDTDHPVIRYYLDSNNIVANSVFQLEGLPTDAKTTSLSAQYYADGHLLSSIDPTQTVWGQNLGTDAAPTFNKGLRHKRKMTNTWGTVCLPYEITSNEYVQLYAVESCDVSGDEGTLTVVPVESVAANVPCFVKKLNAEADSICLEGGDYIFKPYDGTEVTSATSATGWSMVGTYKKVSDLTDVYYVASDKMWYAEDPISVAPYRAYMTYSDGSVEAKSFAIFVDDTNGIKGVNDDDNDGESIYNIAGQRLSAPQKGQINIINGKKILVK